MKRLVVLGCALLAIAAMMLSGCGASAQNKQLQQQSWRVTAIDYNTYAMPAPITAKFADGKITGTTGLNEFAGTYKLEGANGIVVTVDTTTKKTSSGEDQALESQFLEALRSSKSLAVDGASLTLRSGTGLVLLSFEADLPTPLVGTTWKMLSYSDGRGGLAAPIDSSAVTVVFEGDGTISGSAGLAAYHGKYAASGTNLKFTSPLTQQEQGAPNLAVQDSAFLGALQQAVSFTIEGKRLTLHNAAGDVAAQYQAQ
jgi:heat shock protein HslJ